MFPLSTVLFPEAPLPLHVFEPRYRRLTADCLAGDGTFGVVLITRGSEVGGGDQRVSVGTVAQIEEAAPLPDGRWVLMARGTDRFRVTQWLPDDPYPRAEVDEVPAAGWTGTPELLETAESGVRRARGLLSELGELPALAPGAPLGSAPEEIVWRLCAEAPLNALDRQQLLEVDDPVDRVLLLRRLVDALTEDLSRLLAGGGTT
jgi:Lon protease-like protein